MDIATGRKMYYATRGGLGSDNECIITGVKTDKGAVARVKQRTSAPGIYTLPDQYFEPLEGRR